MVQRGGGDSSFNGTPNPMNNSSTCLPSSKRLVEESVDGHGPVKRLKLVNSDTTTFDPSCPKLQVPVANSQPQDTSQQYHGSEVQDSGRGLSSSTVSEVPVATIADSGEGLSTASPTVEATCASAALSPSVVSPLQNENGDSIAIGSSSSQSRITTTVSLEAKAEQFEESIPAASSEGSTEAQQQRPSSPPLKSTKMSHLKRKYTGELEYMLREFRKLERQLLGAKGNVLEESAGSRERREKLHSFIIHLEGTIREIEVGCQLEAQGKSTVQVGTESGDPEEAEEQAKKRVAESAALSKLTREKEEEENVQKLEEHILANLLPVKVRLKKQLAAQQGASQNPAGMPARRGSLAPATTVTTGTTFAAAAEQRRKAEAARLAATAASTPVVAATAPSPVTAATAATASKTDSQYSNSLAGGGSSLTQKLLGSTTGPNNPESRGAPSTTSESNASATDKPATPVPTDGQTPSNAAPATASRDVTIGKAVTAASKPPVASNKAPITPVPVASSATAALKAASAALKTPVTVSSSSTSPPPPQPSSTGNAVQPTVSSTIQSDLLDDDCDDLSFTEEERKRMRKRKRKKKLRRDAQRTDHQQDQRDLMLHQQAVQAANAAPKGAAKRNNKAQGAVASNLINNKGPANGKKKGPRTVEYICALCSESYNSTCDYNPWWALVQHECPKCRKTQIPRVDISTPANAIEYHPALLASADDTGGGGGNAGGAVASAPTVHTAQTQIKPNQVSSTVAAVPVETTAPVSPPQLNTGFYSDDSDSGSELSDELLLTDASDDDSFLDSDDSDLESFLQSFSPGEQAENESFGFEYTGPKLSDSDAARLLILIDHASTCPGRHKSTQHREVCRSTKFLMLHVRDCPGTTSTFDVCPFSWCRKTKHLLYHLVSCTNPNICSVCTPADLSQNFLMLRGLNEHRRMKQRERMLAVSATARSKALSSGPSGPAGAGNGSKAHAPQHANVKASHPSRQPPATSTPKIISTSIKPISGQRPGATLAPSQTSSILQRPKASMSKAVAKPALATAPVQPVSKASHITQSVVPAIGTASSPPLQQSVPPPPTPKGPIAIKLENGSVGTASLAESAVPDLCASTGSPGGQSTSQAGAPGMPGENTASVSSAISGPAETTQEAMPSKSIVFSNGSYQVSATEAPPGLTLAGASGAVATPTSAAENVVGGLLTHSPIDYPATQTEPPMETDLNSCLDVSIPKSQNALPIVNTTIGAHDGILLPEPESQRSPAGNAIDDVTTQASETVKVGC